MDKKILVSMMVIGLVATLTGAGLYAYFNDTETSTGNTFTAGTLDLEFRIEELGVPVGTFMEFKNIAPGDNTYGPDGIFGNDDDETVVFRLDNVGTIDGIVSIDVKNLVNYENDCNPPEAEVDETCGEEEGELGEKLVIILSYVYYPEGVHGGEWVGETPDEPWLWKGTLNDLADLDWSDLPETPLLGEGGAYFTIGWEVPSEVGNIIQSDSVAFDIEFTLTQA